MNQNLVEALITMGDDEKQIGLTTSDGSPLALNVGPLDKAAGKLLRSISVIFKEPAQDPDWVMALLNAAQFWLTLGCSMETGGPGPTGRVIGEEEAPFVIEGEIPNIPKKAWRA